ncbi:MAG: hypothetical protein ABEJ27_06680 [Halodesulfurarchaeum sp.]
MDIEADDLAGLVDLFGALPRDDLVKGVEELTFRRGTPADSAEIAAAVASALDRFALLSVTLDGEEVLVPGPTAFPAVPEGGEDLPHILDVERRDVPQEVIEEAVRRRLAGEAARLDDPERAAELVDVTYDAEAWAGLDLSDVRARLEALAEESGSGASDPG